MNPTPTSATSSAATASRSRSTSAQTRSGPGVRTAPTASREAIRAVAVILQVLGGALTPTQAAAVLEVSLPRYYALELKALEGMADACEPKGAGRRRSPEREAELLRRDKERLERECARQQALARSAQRAMGLAVKPPPERAKKDASGKRRRIRRPTVRALKVVRGLQQRMTASKDEPPADAGGMPAAE